MTGLPRTCALLTTVSILVGLSSAQDVKRLADMNLGDLSQVPIVSAARHQQNRNDSPRALSVITAEEIRRRNFRNVPEAIAGVTGVYLQQTNYAGGSPIVRGVVGNRILIMVNGIRMNNGTFRLGPNQYLNFFDINQVDRIEVLRGAGSVLYGSDAFGGVINIITKTAPGPNSRKEMSAYTRFRFSSADASASGRLEVSAAAGAVGLTMGITQDHTGDLHAGQGTGPQKGTGYEQSAGNAAIILDLGKDRSLTAGFSRLKQMGVSRSDLLRAGSDLKYLWHPEGRDLAYMQYTQPELWKYVGAVQVTVAYQRPFEYLNRITAAEPLVERFHSDVVQSLSLGVQLSSAVASSHVLTYGFDTAGDWVSSSRMNVDRPTGVQTPKTGTYPDGSRFQNTALFVQDEVRLSDRLDGVLGARYDRFHLQSQPHDEVTGRVAIDSAPSAFTGSGHLKYRITKQISATGGVSQGFRAPNVDDSTILGSTGGRWEVPNGSLRPERSVSVEYGFRAKTELASASVVVFDDHYRNLIDRGQGYFNGLPFLDLDGNGIQDSREPSLFQRQNITRATVRGVEIEALANLAQGWIWTHNTTWTRGTDLSRGQPLTRIPPLNGTSRLTWQSPKTFWVEGVVVAATAQRRLSAADKTDSRIGPGGTSGYAAFHVRAGIRRSALAGLTVAWENITNKRYRLHGSGIDRPGSNVVLGFSRVF